MNVSTEKATSGRAFLKASLAVAGAAIISNLRPRSAIAGRASGPKTKTVYRFRTRRTRTCNACKQHRRFKVFMNLNLANRNRAHLGCNCPIVTQKVPMRTFQMWVKDHGVRGGVIDLRS